MEKAKKVFVFYTSQKRKPFALKRSRTQVSVKDIPDRDETIMRLAFLAALHNYNAIIETEIVSEKVRNHGYQKSNWRGKAIPILLDEKKLSIFED
jgi:hypothetical protein